MPLVYSALLLWLSIANLCFGNRVAFISWDAFWHDEKINEKEPQAVVQPGGMEECRIDLDHPRLEL